MKLLSRLRRNKEEDNYDPDNYPKWRNLERKTIEATFTTYTIKVVRKDGTEDYMECEGYHKTSSNVAHDNFRRTTNVNIKDKDYLNLEFLEDVYVKDTMRYTGLKTKTKQKRQINMDEVYYWEEVDATEKKATKEVTVGMKETLSNDNSYVKERRTIKEEHGDIEYEEIEDGDQ